MGAAAPRCGRCCDLPPVGLALPPPHRGGPTPLAPCEKPIPSRREPTDISPALWSVSDPPDGVVSHTQSTRSCGSAPVRVGNPYHCDAPGSCLGDTPWLSFS